LSQAVQRPASATVAVPARLHLGFLDLNGGLDRMKGPGAVENLSFQVVTGSLTGPLTKWKPEQFFDSAPLEAVLKDIGRR